MGFNLDQVPDKKPNAFGNDPIPDGFHKVTIEQVDYTVSTNNNKMLKIRFKLEKGGRFVFDQIMDEPTNQLNVYRLSKLLKAVNIEPTGVLELKDIPKILRKGMRLTIAVITKGQYTNVDISGSKDGYYPYNYNVDHEDPVGEPGVPGDAGEEPTTNESPAPQIQTAGDDEFY